jgi:transposase InsO family protein
MPAEVPQMEYLVSIAQAAAEAKHGQKGAIYKTACEHLHISLAELHRRLNQVTVRPKRKRRTDAGTTALTFDEASMVCGYVTEHIRRHGKRIKSVDQAIAELRANGHALGETVDPATGEVKRLSVSAILRALRTYGLHPAQIAAPDPVTRLSSPHPNWCWQIDASLCVIFKLPVEGRRIEEVGTQEAYKNKLGNFARIEHLLVQRYLITDHASGAIVPHFGLGGESAEGLIAALINAFIGQPGRPIRGAPNILMLDQASANRSAMVRNLCHSLGIELSYTMPGNPRSKGQVEQAHNLFECGFESGLKLAGEIGDIGQLQILADRWADWFNGSRQHTRHGMTRYEAWQTITEAQLRLVTVDAKALRMLARSAAKDCKVTPALSVNFHGAEYDVSGIAGVLVGQTLPVCRSAFDPDAAMVLTEGPEGREALHPVPKIETDRYGFAAGAATIGRDFKRPKDTATQANKKSIERLAMGAATDTDAAAARKAKAVPYGGTINPYQQADDYQAPAWLPKRGNAVDLPRPEVNLPPVTVVGAAKRLMALLGAGWQPAFYADLQRRYPEGVPEKDMDGLAAEFRAIASGERPARGTPSLRVVGE